jgi:hypothetical protein
MVKLGETTVNRRVGAFRPRLVPYLRLASIAFAISPLSFLTTTGRGASGDWRPARLDCRRSRRGGERSPTARVISPISIASGLRSCTGRSCNAPGRSGPRSVRAAPWSPRPAGHPLGVVRPDLAATSQPRGSFGHALGRGPAPTPRARRLGSGWPRCSRKATRCRLWLSSWASTSKTAGRWWARWRRERAPALFDAGHSPSSVARQLGVARQTAVSWRARWRAGGAAGLEYRRGRGPAIPDRQLPLIEQALLQGPAAHGFDGEVWSAP